MSTWEDRMAKRAALREQERLERQRAEDDANDPHASHHAHLDGTAVYCSCGEFHGVTCVAFPAFDTDEEMQAFYDSLACRECGKKGVTGPLGG